MSLPRHTFIPQVNSYSPGFSGVTSRPRDDRSPEDRPKQRAFMYNAFSLARPSEDRRKRSMSRHPLTRRFMFKLLVATQALLLSGATWAGGGLTQSAMKSSLVPQDLVSPAGP